MFDEDHPGGLTGYELKRLADSTLRFYWVSPAMSQVYTVLARLREAGFVESAVAGGAARYRITGQGQAALLAWLWQRDPGFPVLRHPIALRLLLGRSTTPDQLVAMLDSYLDALDTRRAELERVRAQIAGQHRYRYAALVAEWGLAYFDSEARSARSLRQRVRDVG